MTAKKVHNKRRFRLKLVQKLRRGRWMCLPEAAIGGWAGSDDGLEGPGLLDRHFGLSCNYGALFTYLFRRFGFPNEPSDDYKDIASYCLSTPLPDMVLITSPSVSDWPRLSFRFLISGDAWNRIERQPRERWQNGLAEWTESQGVLPEWMPEWLEFWKTKPGVAERTTGDIADWRLSIPDMIFVSSTKPAETISVETRSLLQSVSAFIDQVQTAFEAIEPRPWNREREANWMSWPDNDPLKPYYAAAAVALEDLSTPVRVRDSQINAHGLVEDDSPLARKILNEPAVAGMAFGYYVNQEPDAAADLFFKTAKLGRGKLAKGVTKLFPDSAMAKGQSAENQLP